MIEFTQEQKQAYARFIRARDKVKLVKTRDNMKNPYIPHSDVIQTVDVAGMNHPLFEQNDDWIEYKEASAAWWKVEPAFRDKERMRMSRGDYGRQDSWDIPKERVSDLVSDVKSINFTGRNLEQNIKGQ